MGRPTILALTLVPLLLAAACASSPPPEDAPSSGEEFVKAHVPQETPETGVAEEPAAQERPATVVIAEADEEPEYGRSLVEAARAERARRREAAPPAIIITDENLDEYAVGELTLVSGSGVVAGEAGAETTAVVSEAEAERYWRDRVRRAREDLKTTREEIAHLEGKVAELRRRFYDEDDPYFRDAQIKPEWDRALERLDDARAEELDLEAAIDRVLEEGRQAGALPGWLREGLELIPEQDDEAGDRLPEHEPREPTTVEVEEPGGG